MNLSPTMKNYRSDLSSDLIFEDTSGCVSRLKHIPVGEMWSLDEIQDRKERLLFKGREWMVVDNLVVHDVIKTGGNTVSNYIENYQKTLINLAQCGIKSVCYNFMPVFFKVRTHFNLSFENKHAFSMFDPVAFAVFDLYILQRPGAEESYSNYQKHQAQIFNSRLLNIQKLQLTENILESVQSSLAITLNELKSKMEPYSALTDEELSFNLQNFRKHVLPVAKDLSLHMCFNVDDPCGHLLGLPSVKA